MTPIFKGICMNASTGLTSMSPQPFYPPFGIDISIPKTQDFISEGDDNNQNTEIHSSQFHSSQEHSSKIQPSQVSSYAASLREGQPSERYYTYLSQIYGDSLEEIKTIENAFRTSSNEAIKIRSANDNLTSIKPDLYLLPEASYVVNNYLGKGVQSSVFAATRIGIHGTPPRVVAVKKSQSSYRGEFELLNMQLGQLKDPRIDHFQRVATLSPSSHIAIFEISDMALRQVNYKSKMRPVAFVIEQLIGMAGGIGILHKNGLVHRDINGANLLVNEHGCGKVTDMGTVMLTPVPGTIHPVCCTPVYVAPFVFKGIKNQIDRLGHQGTEADVYSFGRTIQRDVTQRIFFTLGEKFRIDFSSYFERLKEREIKDFSQEKIETLENEYSEQVIVYLSLGQWRARLLPKPVHTYHENLKAIADLSSHLEENEGVHLKKLARLAFRLQSMKPEKLMTIHAVENELKKIIADEPVGVAHKIKRMGDGGDESFSPPEKRRKK